jgi:hypothetical protein
MLMNNHKKLKTPHKWDAALAIAFETIEKEKCPKCGVPIWYAYSEDSSIAFKHDHVDCHACAFDEVESKKIRNPQPGRTMFVTPVLEDGFDALPTRQDFQMELIKKAAKEATK